MVEVEVRIVELVLLAGWDETGLQEVGSARKQIWGKSQLSVGKELGRRWMTGTLLTRKDGEFSLLLGDVAVDVADEIVFEVKKWLIFWSKRPTTSMRGHVGQVMHSLVHSRIFFLHMTLISSVTFSSIRLIWLERDWSSASKFRDWLLLSLFEARRCMQLDGIHFGFELVHLLGQRVHLGLGSIGLGLRVGTRGCWGGGRRGRSNFERMFVCWSGWGGVSALFRSPSEPTWRWVIVALVGREASWWI